jgi:hypothetical protein
VSFIYCHESPRSGRWFYCETPGFRACAPGSSSSFGRDKSKAYRFATKEEAWEHCRKRRKGDHWRGRPYGKWIVIRVKDAPSAPPPEPKCFRCNDTKMLRTSDGWCAGWCLDCTGDRSAKATETKEK